MSISRTFQRSYPTTASARLDYILSMTTRHVTPIDPLAEIRSDPVIAALPKADLHVHQEWAPRLDRALARREGRQPHDWRSWARRMMAETPAGMKRLRRLGEVTPVPLDAHTSSEYFVAWVEDLLDEAATDGAVLVEVRFGREEVLRPGFMALFREAERRVQTRHPSLCAEAIIILMPWRDPELLERLVSACLRAADEGLGGIDVLYEPYDTEAEWEAMYRASRRAVEAGLGVTAHAGEFSVANIAAALRMPGITRIGHATHAADDPRLLDLVLESGVTVECSLSSNVVLGAVPSYEKHPFRRLVECGVPLAICTDIPVQICTTIGREYAIAAQLGFAPTDLLGFTANAVRASFAPAERKQDVLDGLRQRFRH